MNGKPRDWWVYVKGNEIVTSFISPAEHVRVIEHSAYEAMKAERDLLEDAVGMTSKDFQAKWFEIISKERDEARAEAISAKARIQDACRDYMAERAKSQKLVVTLKRVLAWARDKHELPHYSEMLYDAEQSIAEYAKDTPVEYTGNCPHCHKGLRRRVSGSITDYKYTGYSWRCDVCLVEDKETDSHTKSGSDE